jgi:hypothetical protein
LATGLKRKIQQSVACRKPISSTETSTGLGWKSWRRFTKPMAPQKQAGVAILRQSRLQNYIDQMR